MEEQRIEQVLNVLSQYMPRAPEETVEKMVHTVNAMEEKQRSMKVASEPKQEEISKESIELQLKQPKGGPTL